MNLNDDNRTEIKNYSNLNMKPDYLSKALYCGKNGHIFLESFTNYYKEISDFLIAIGEPIHRTKYIHEYQLTKYSLYAAAAMNIKTNDILLILDNLSKNNLPEELINLIKENTDTYGKLRLILENNRYFIECNNNEADKKILDTVYNFQKIYSSHLIANEKFNNRNNVNINPYQNTGLLNSNTIISIPNQNITEFENNFENNNKENYDDIKSNKLPKGNNYFEIYHEDVEEIKQICIENQYPLLEEYDYNNDKNNPPLNITPKLENPVRAYQEKALNIMFSNERARSGIIVLPCGAGKTLVGILSACTIKKNTIILCNSAVSVHQWYNEFNYWSVIKPKRNICRFTSKYKDDLWDLKKEGGILIVTYSMLSFKGKRSNETEKIIQSIKSIEWGLMILDEVQVLPAKIFRQILSVVKTHCKLGLTATLVREDLLIKDLQFLIGPKHYEANWLDLQRDGYLARVKCVEIWCEMELKFYEEYLKTTEKKRRLKLYVANPNKLLICLKLIEKHKNEKILIFSDDLFTLTQYKNILDYPVISGNVSEKDRNKILNEFKKNNSECNVILMSKVGDTSIDLPNAKVIIQISSHFGSRRQEAQRLGRILRPKADDISEYNAFFYTIITKNTEEIYFSAKRHRFLVDQGFYFKVVTNLKEEYGFNIEDIRPKYKEYSNKILENIKFYNDNNYKEVIDDIKDFWDPDFYKDNYKLDDDNEMDIDENL